MTVYLQESTQRSESLPCAIPSPSNTAPSITYGQQSSSSLQSSVEPASWCGSIIQKIKSVLSSIWNWIGRFCPCFRGTQTAPPQQSQPSPPTPSPQYTAWVQGEREWARSHVATPDKGELRRFAAIPDPQLASDVFEMVLTNSIEAMIQKLKELDQTALWSNEEDQLKLLQEAGITRPLSSCLAWLGWKRTISQEFFGLLMNKYLFMEGFYEQVSQRILKRIDDEKLTRDWTLLKQWLQQLPPSFGSISR
jgi:hypothetical protein